MGVNIGSLVGAAYSLSASGAKIFAGTNRGIFMSSDNGLTWKQTSLMNRWMSSICSNNNTVLATRDFSGILRSINDGLTWVPILIDKKKEVSHIVSDGSNFYASTWNDFYVSTDNGKDWELTSLETKKITSVACSGSHIYGGTMRNGIFSSSNEGKNWVNILDNIKDIGSIAGDGSELFVVIRPNTIYHTFNMGQIWTKFKFNRKWANTISFIGSNLLVGADSGIYISTNYGINWSQTSLKNVAVYTFAQNSSGIFFGTLHGGVYFSSDEGSNWTQTSLVNLEIVPEIFERNQFQGTWEDFIYVPAGSDANLVFINIKSDSFDYHNLKRTDVFFTDSCHRAWGDDYASGKFSIDENYIYFSGNFTDNTYKNILTSTGCNKGKFELTYKYKYYSNHMLELDLIEPKQLPPNTTAIKTKLYLYKK